MAKFKQWVSSVTGKIISKAKGLSDKDRSLERTVNRDSTFITSVKELAEQYESYPSTFKHSRSFCEQYARFCAQKSSQDGIKTWDKCLEEYFHG